MSVNQFFAFEDSLPPGEKWELIQGRLVMMAGGALRHSQICANLIAALHGRLRDTPCIMYTSDANVSREEASTSAYPDVVIRCGDPLGDVRTMTDPFALIEVASPSSEHADFGSKLEAYTLIPSLQAYAVVRQDEWRVEIWRRAADDEWDKDVLKSVDSVLELPGLDVSVPLLEIYDRISGINPD